MSRRHRRSDQDDAALSVHDGMDRLSILTTRANLLWLASHQRDVAAREASRGSAFTGMPMHRSTEPRLPGVLNGPDLSGRIARNLDGLVRELMDAVPEWRPDPAETRRWADAAGRVEQVCETPQDALAWWDTAADLRAAAERTLGPAAAGKFLGWCAVPDCGGDIRIADDQVAAVCPECGGFVTREQQHAYILEMLEERLMTVSQITTALVTVGAMTPYPTVQSWTRPRGYQPPRLLEHIEWAGWMGFPFVTPPSGLYRFGDAFTLAAKRATRVRLEGSAA